MAFSNLEINSLINKTSKDVDFGKLAERVNDRWIKNIATDFASNSGDLESLLLQVFFESSPQLVEPVAEEISASDMEKWIRDRYENPGSGFIYEHLDDAVWSTLVTSDDD